ncbi:MAG: hypothetical protein ACK55I_17870, partial [bacterium]
GRAREAVAGERAGDRRAVAEGRVAEPVVARRIAARVRLPVGADHQVVPGVVDEERRARREDRRDARDRGRLVACGGHVGAVRQGDERGRRVARKRRVGGVEEARVAVEARDRPVREVPGAAGAEREVRAPDARAGRARHRVEAAARARAPVVREARVVRPDGEAVRVREPDADELGVVRQVLGEVAREAADLLIGQGKVAHPEEDHVPGGDPDVARAAARGGPGLGIDHRDGRRRQGLGDEDQPDAVSARVAREEQKCGEGAERREDTDPWERGTARQDGLQRGVPWVPKHRGRLGLGPLAAPNARPPTAREPVRASRFPPSTAFGSLRAPPSEPEPPRECPPPPPRQPFPRPQGPRLVLRPHRPAPRRLSLQRRRRARMAAERHDRRARP